MVFGPKLVVKSPQLCSASWIRVPVWMISRFLLFCYFLSLPVVPPWWLGLCLWWIQPFRLRSWPSWELHCFLFFFLFRKVTQLYPLVCFQHSDTEQLPSLTKPTERLQKQSHASWTLPSPTADPLNVQILPFLSTSNRAEPPSQGLKWGSGRRTDRATGDGRKDEHLVMGAEAAADRSPIVNRVWNSCLNETSIW